MWPYLTSLFQAQSHHESQFSQAALPAASPLAPPLYPLNPENVPASAGSQRNSIYPGLSDFMGLDISPQALAELTSQYAVAIPQPVSVCHDVSLSRIMFVHFSLLWEPGMLELQDVSSKCLWSTCLSVLYRVIKKSLCTWWLQYRKLRVMLKVSPRQSPDITDTLNCVLEDRVQYSTVHIPNVFCDGHFQITSCVGIVRIHWVRCTETFWSPCSIDPCQKKYQSAFRLCSLL